MNETSFDVFISHASEDKEAVVFPLADLLRSLGVRVWYDAFELQIGDSLVRKIDEGLAKSAFGIVVVSPDFLKKNWPEYELRGLVTREISGERVILPLWHNVSREEVIRYSPSLADKLALNTGQESVPQLAREIVKVIRPDIYKTYLRAYLHKVHKLKSIKKIPAHEIMHGIVRHPTLPQALVTRIISIHAITEDVLPMSLKETLYSFRCNTHPEREIAVWERIGACYYLATYGQSFDFIKRRDIFAVLLAASLGPVEDEERAQRSSLTHEEFSSLITLYDSDLSALELLEPLQGHAGPDIDTK